VEGTLGIRNPSGGYQQLSCGDRERGREDRNGGGLLVQVRKLLGFEPKRGYQQLSCGEREGIGAEAALVQVVGSGEWRERGRDGCRGAEPHS
jgi:hypothetical protein